MTHLKNDWIFLLILPVFLFACNSHPGDHPANSNEQTHATADTMPVNDPFMKNGEEKTKYENGVLQTQGNYIKNKRDGDWFSWYSSGRPWSETWFENGVKTGPTKTWFDNGKLRYEGQFKNDVKTGVWKYYEESGKLAKVIDYSKK
jgi:antitoxin component YwqK of YwqJK toxin-antitoxin module